MKRIALILLTVFMSVFLVSCSKTGERVDALPGSNSYKIYCLTNEETELVSERFSISEEDTEALIKALIERLDVVPENISYKKAKPDQVVIEDFKLDSGGKLTLEFNSDYSLVTGVSEVLMRAAIVKTLCQVPQVDSVEFYVDGQPLMKNSDKAVGYMRGGDFIDNTGDGTNFYQYADITLYFPVESGLKLTMIPVSVKYDGTIALEQLILKQLIAGPEKISGANKEHVKSGIPGLTKINMVSVVDGICYVDFSQEFLSKVEGVSPEICIYSIVNSLVELPHIDKVEIAIDGKTNLNYQDEIFLGQTFERNLDLTE